MEKFSEPKKVLEVLKDVAFNKRKTILSALVIITDNKEYRELMGDDIRSYNTDISKQEKSETQEANWIEPADVANVFAELKRNADLIYKKSHKTPSDIQQIQNYIIIALLGGIFISPRRAKDFCDFKIKNMDKETDNFIDKKKMVFNSYKTAKTYGKQEIAIPPALKTILTKWFSVNPTDYLLFDTNMNPMTAVKLNQRINRIFDKKVGVNILRHSYLTDKFGETIQQKKEIADTMGEMGSSSNMLETYVKN
jgi:integrase